MEQIDGLVQLIKNAKSISFLTGAGASTESGVPDFRSSNGLWKNNQSYESLISRSFFEKNPNEFWKYYKEIFAIKLLRNYEPNSGHYFISELQDMNKEITVITQNIDGLYKRANVKNVIEVHGTLETATCLECKIKYDLSYINQNETPRCNRVISEGKICDLILKPDVVLYGDSVDQFNEALNVAYNSDLFIVMGSSLEVGPINTIPQYIARTNIPMVLINKEKTKYDHLFDVCIYSGIGETVKQVKKLL